ncbi:hypothetical protein BC835DRAFT_1311726 [Cytidiella melzeri]|nr:hypothetical protein BC835DRAFT_1311726 [Cytidiella melzeri]
MTLCMLYKDDEKYRNLLQSIISSAEESTDNGRTQLSLLEQYSHTRWKGNGRRDLVYPSDPGSAEHEEVVVRLSGFVLRTNLPPITRIEQLPKNPYAARQSLTLTGLSLSNFDSNLRAVSEVHSYFADNLPNGALQPLKHNKDGGHSYLEVSNRYFTQEVDDMGYPDIAIDPYIDPHGILTSKVTTGRHTEDNTVLYFERMRLDAQSNPPPSESDILLKFKHVLQCTNIQGKIRHAHEVEDVNNQVFHSLVKQPTSPLKKVKRTVGYDTQTYDTDHPVAGMKRLRINAEDIWYRSNIAGCSISKVQIIVWLRNDRRV